MWGSIVSAAGSLAGGIAGGLFNQSSSSQNLAFQREMWQKNYEAQKEFAQNGIRWRVSDAKAAGLHPLVGAGASSSMYSPTSSVGSSSGFDSSFLENASQHIGNAVRQGLTRKERANEIFKQNEMDMERLKSAKLQNLALEQNLIHNQAYFIAQQKLASNTALRSQSSSKDFPTLSRRADGAIIPGQSDSLSPLSKSVPVEIMANDPTVPYAEAGSHPDVKFVRTSSGGYAPVVSSAQEEALEDDFLGHLAWNMRNRIIPTFFHRSGPKPPDSFKKSNQTWVYDPIDQAWHARHKFERPVLFELMDQIDPKKIRKKYSKIY